MSEKKLAGPAKHLWRDQPYAGSELPVQAWVTIGQNPLFDPLWTHLGTLTKTQF